MKATLPRVIDLHTLRRRQSHLGALTAAGCVTLLVAMVGVGQLDGSNAWAATTTGSTTVDTATSTPPTPTTTVNHTVTVSAPPTTTVSQTTHTSSVTINPTTTTTSTSSGSASSIPWWGWALIGLGAVLLLAVVFAFGRSSSRGTNPPADRPPPGNTRPDTLSVTRLR